MKLGISGQALGDVKNFREIVQIGKKYDIFNYEIWTCNAGVENDYAKADAAELKRIIADEGIQIDCVTLGAAFDQESCRQPDKYVSLLMAALDFAKELDAKIVNHYCYFISMSEIPDFRRMEKFWARPMDYAQQLGIPLALENEAHDSTRTPENMAAIMKHFDHPFFKTNYDAVNYFHASCEGFPASYEILRPYIGYVHLKNACLYRPDAKQPEDHRGAPMSGHYSPAPIQYAPLPDGAVNIPGLLTHLQEDDVYHGTCTLEPHTTPEFVEDFYRRESQWLRQLGFFKD